MADDTPKTTVEIELSADSLPTAIRTLLRHWRDCAREQWLRSGKLPEKRLVELDLVAHAAAVSAYVDAEPTTLRAMHGQASGYFNRISPHKMDDTWFHTRARAVDALLGVIEKPLDAANDARDTTLDDLTKAEAVATELVDLVVESLCRIELGFEIVMELPSEFRGPIHRADAIANVRKALMSAHASGQPVGTIAALENVMRGLGHPNTTSLTSAARKREAATKAHGT